VRGLTTLPPNVSLLSRHCGILDISQPSRPPFPVTGIAFLYANVLTVARQNMHVILMQHLFEVLATFQCWPPLAKTCADFISYIIKIIIVFDGNYS
jgi:hypothetical protein